MVLLGVAEAAPQDPPPAGEEGALTLGEAVGLAVAEHRRIHYARHQLDAARGALLQSRAPFEERAQTAFESGTGQQPALGDAWTSTATASFSVDRLTRWGTLAGVGADVGRVASAGGLLPAATCDRARVGIDVQQPLLRGVGAEVNGAPERAASLRVDAERELLGQTVAGRILDTAQRYWDLVAAARQVEVFSAAEARARRLLNETETLVRLHERPPSDLHLLVASRAQWVRSRVAAELARQDAAAALALAMGIAAADGPIRLRATTAPPGQPWDPLPADAEERLVRLALQRHPELQSARLRRQAAGADELAADDLDRPRLDLVGSLAWVAVDDDHAAGRLGVPAGLNASLALRSDLPFFEPEAAGRIQVARAGRRAAEADVERLERGIRVEVASVVASLRRGRDTWRLAAEERRSYESAVNAERAKLRAGLSTVFNVMLLEDRLTAALLHEIWAWRRLLQDLPRLHYAIGALPGGPDPVGPDLAELLMSPPSEAR